MRGFKLDCRWWVVFVPSNLVSPPVQSKTIDSRYKTRLLIIDFGPLTFRLIGKVIGVYDIRLKVF